MTDQNPYESSASNSEAKHSSTSHDEGIRWRLAPTILFGVLGAIILLCGIACTVATIIIARQILGDHPQALWSRDFIGIIAMTLTIYTIGIAWALSARSFWKRRWVAAILYVSAGAVGWAVINALLPSVE